MIVVSNSSPLIFLTRVGKLNLLREVFGEIWIPNAVFHETVTRGKALRIIDASIIEEAVGNWIMRREVTPETSSRLRLLEENERLGVGEKEAVMLCRQLNAKYFVVDDKEARRTARLLQIKTVGTLGVLIHAYKKGLVSLEETEATLDSLVKASFRIDLELYRRIRKEMNRVTVYHPSTNPICQRQC